MGLKTESMQKKGKSKKGWDRYSQRARHHIDAKHAHENDHARNQMYSERERHIQSYHKKRLMKFEKRKHFLNKEEKRLFHLKTQKKLNHIAEHGKDGKHRVGHDERHSQLSEQGQRAYKEGAKKINERHRTSQTHGSHEHRAELKKHMDETLEKQQHNKLDSSQKGEGRNRKFSTLSRRQKKALNLAIKAKNLGKAAAIAGAGGAGFVGHLISSGLQGTSGRLVGVSQHAQGMMENSAQSMGRGLQQAASGSRASGQTLGLGAGEPSMGPANQGRDNMRRDREGSDASMSESVESGDSDASIDSPKKPKE